MTLNEMIRQDRTSLQERKDLLQQGIEASVAEFLSRGGEIQQIENGTTATNKNGHTMTTQQYWSHKTKEAQDEKNLPKKRQAADTEGIVV